MCAVKSRRCILDEYIIYEFILGFFFLFESLETNIDVDVKRYAKTWYACGVELSCRRRKKHDDFCVL